MDVHATGTLVTGPVTDAHWTKTLRTKMLPSKTLRTKVLDSVGAMENGRPM